MLDPKKKKKIKLNHKKGEYLGRNINVLKKSKTTLKLILKIPNSFMGDFGNYFAFFLKEKHVFLKKVSSFRKLELSLP